MLSEAIADHRFGRLRRRPFLSYLELTHQIDVVGCLDSVPDRSDNRAESKRSLDIDIWFMGRSGIRTLLKPAPDGLIAINSFLILLRRDVQLACDTLQKV